MHMFLSCSQAIAMLALILVFHYKHMFLQQLCWVDGPAFNVLALQPLTRCTGPNTVCRAYCKRIFCAHSGTNVLFWVLFLFLLFGFAENVLQKTVFVEMCISPVTAQKALIVKPWS